MKKIKISVIVICLLILVELFSGCSMLYTVKTPKTIAEDQDKQEEIILQGDFPQQMAYSSGVGGWYTTIILSADGTFSGEYYDSQMGVTGLDYPHGTVYLCNFSGKFDIKEKPDDCTYILELKRLDTDKTQGEEWIENGVRYVVSNPYGLDGAKKFALYTPCKKIDNLSQDFLNWRPVYYSDSAENTLGVYALHNVDEGCGFFTASN